ncbi:peptidyl-tRNA hydrolase [Arthrobacter methylotrophus]|uniref:peptidyl-tRNA hydrolase n=1 Tax=Arthrobacter methylotrophus TaxID=121291 RepID=A0ABV5URD6_9MICC
MTATPSLVQPIVLLVDKNDPAGHRDSILAAAIASVEAYAGTSTSGAVQDEAWAHWLSGRFTKSVRRADLKTFGKLAADVSNKSESLITIGKAKAMAYAPAAYEEMPKSILRLQVSGTDLPDVPATVPSRQRSGDPVIVLNGALGMSTGKAAAQAAHALFAWQLNRGLDDAELASLQLLSTGLVIATAEEFAALRMIAAGPLIVDAGLTEIAPDTATAFVIERP